MTNDLQKTETHTPMSGFQQMVAAVQGGVDAAQAEVLYKIMCAEREQQQEVAYIQAMNAVAQDVPVVKKRGINKQTNSRYALIEDIDAALRPVYSRNGFSLSFDTEEASREMVTVVCKVAHSGGHTRTHKLPVPVDSVGIKGNRNKTDTHGVASAVTYGCRILTGLIFSVVSSENDDDGNAAGGNAQSVITREQVQKLISLAKNNGHDIDSLLAQWPVDRLEDIAANDYRQVFGILSEKAIR